MSRKYAILPCNGLDKPAGPLTREVAIALLEADGGELVCPVLLQRAPARYEKVTSRLPLLVIDGCATRCASRLAADRGLKVDTKLQIAEAAKQAKLDLGDSLAPDASALAFCRDLAAEILKEKAAPAEMLPSVDFSSPVEYESFAHDKYVFRVPKEGYYFNENDCWVRVSGNRARIGISDYMQQSLSDILFCEPPAVGAEIEQFGEAGVVESPKATFEVVSPVGGRVIAVNAEAVDRPELINSSPYEDGWIVELELADFESDRELLLDGSRYMELLRKKVAEHGR